MAYLGSTTRDRTTAGPSRPSSAAAPGLGLPLGGRRAAAEPPPPYPPARRWRLPEAPEGTGTFGMGLAIGLTLGAGLALLLTPRSGPETRAALRRSARRAGVRGRNVWDDLRDELQFAARRGRRKVKRAAQRGTWAAEDAWDDRRQRGRRGAVEMD